MEPQLEGEHSTSRLYEGSMNIKNSLSCICMSPVAVCAHVVMNVGGGEIRNVWRGHNTICNLVQ